MLLWVADIGGTNCRLAEFTANDISQRDNTIDLHDSLQLVHEYVLPTAEICDGHALVSAFAKHFAHSVQEIKGLGIAVAGHVQGTHAKLTNAQLTLDSRELASKFALKEVLLLNDFAAQAYACADPKPSNCQALTSLKHAKRAVRALVGAGTGLGCALLVPTAHNLWQALPSEAGHMYFPFTGDEEEAFAQWLCTKLNKQNLEAEDVLSGRGLMALHAYLTGEQKTPAEIASSHLQNETPTQYWWASFYGRFCRMWIWATLPVGGLFISGGIAIQNPAIVHSEAFFSELGLHELEPKIAPIPLFLFTNTQIGLYGCAIALQNRLLSNVLKQ